MCWQGLPEGRCSLVPQGSMPGSGDGAQEVGLSGSETAGGRMAVEKVGKIRGCKVIEGFVGEEKFVLYSIRQCM